MARKLPEKTYGDSAGKITAAHLAGLRPRPPREPRSEKWDLSTAFVAGFALALFALPEMGAVFGFGMDKGAPHSASGLLVLLGVVAVFGVFPVVFLHHVFLQNFRHRPSRLVRFVSALLAIGLMHFATGAMKPLVGYEQKIAENRRFESRIVGEASRSPASAPVESIRQGTLFFR